MTKNKNKGALLIYLTAICLSFIVFLFVGHEEEEHYKDKFLRQAQVFEKVFEEQAYRSFNALYALEAFYMNSEKVSFEEFSGFSKYLLDRSPTIAALEWIPRVEHKERAVFEKRIRDLGYSNFKFTEKNSAGQMIKAGVRAYYYPVYFVEPYRLNQSAHGFDLGSHPGRFDAIKYAFSQTDVACTEPIQLVQDNKVTPAVLIFMPVNQDSLVLAVLRIGEIFSQTQKQLRNKDMRYELSDITGEVDLPVIGNGEVSNSSEYNYDFIVPVGGRKWLIKVTPSLASSKTIVRWVILSILLTFSSLLYLYIVKQANQKEIVEVLVEERTRDLKSARNLALSASVSKSEFLANMSHEIRTPMTAILGYIDILKESCEISNSEELESIEIIEKNGKHLLSIINDILDLSKIEAGKLQIEKVEFSVFKAIDEIYKLLLPRTIVKNVDFRAEWQFPMPELIVSDPVRFRQILINLLGNAIKFTKKGEVVISMFWDDEKSILTFKVKDTGIGMGQEQKERIFDAFSQADASITRKFGGTGLGLTITHRLVQMMGGSIEVFSEIKKGSTFIVSFNIMETGGKMLTEVPYKSKTLVGLEEGALSGSVLLVDDNITNLTLISKILKKANLTVECCMNGKEAVEILEKENSFDVVVMDVQMPVMDGFTAAKRLRAGGYEKPVIALTANNMKGDKEACLAAGYSDFTSKPINKKELFGILRKYLF